MATTDKTHKTCVRCLKLARPALHPLSAFPANPKTKDQKSSWCQPCHTQYRRQWLAEKSAEWRANWRDAQNAKKREQRRIESVAA